MAAKGRNDGIEGGIFPAAHQFFAKGECPGYKQPRAKSRKTDTAEMEKCDVDEMPNLDGKGMRSIRVYDTCDDIRTKINSHLRKTGLTKEAFAKELSKRQAAGEPDINGGGITKFQTKKGPLAGSSNRFFYASYVFFQKLRVKEGKEKSKKRIEMEEVHGTKGVMTDRPIETMHFKMIRGDSLYADKYAKLSEHVRSSLI